MGERIVDEGGPEQHEDQKAAELDPLCDRAGDEGRRDDGEHHLVDHEGLMGDGGGVAGIGLQADAVQADPGQAADQAVDVRPEGDAVSPQDPLDTDDGHQDEALHDGSQHVVPSDHPAVEQRQAGRGHHEHQRGRGEHPRGVAAVQLGLGRRGRARLGAGSGLAAADEVAVGDIVCCAPAGTTTIQQAVNTRARM